MQMEGRFGLRDAAAAHIRKHPREQHAGDEADHGRHEKQASRRRVQAEQQPRRAVDGDRKEHGGETSEDADQDGEREKELVFAESQLLKGQSHDRQFRRVSCCLPMSSSARSSAETSRHD